MPREAKKKPPVKEEENFNPNRKGISKMKMDIKAEYAGANEMIESDLDFCMISLAQRLGVASIYLAYSPALNEDAYNFLRKYVSRPSVIRSATPPQVIGTAIKLNPFKEYSFKDILFVPNDIYIFIFSMNDVFSGHSRLLESIARLDNTNIFYPVYDDSPLVGSGSQVYSVINLTRGSFDKPKEPSIPSAESLLESVEKKTGLVVENRLKSPEEIKKEEMEMFGTGIEHNKTLMKED